jgi:apolipoprotein N-acyltransferase
MKNPWLRLALVSLSGILGFLCFPTADQSYLAWAAFLPLVICMSESRGVPSAALAGFVSGAIQNCGLLLWVPPVMFRYGGLPNAASWVIYLLLVALQASFTGTACAITRYCVRRGGPPLLLTFPFAWVCMEYLESHFPFGGFPWLLAGYSQTNWLRMIQFADITGIYGVSFLVLWINTALAWIILKQSSRTVRFAPLALGILAITGALLYGGKQLSHWDALNPDGVAALLQENISVEDSPAAMDWKFSEGYVRLSDRLRAGRTDLLVLPESPSPLSFQYDEHYRALIGGLARRFPLGLILNNISFSEVDGATRYFNSAYFVDRNGIEVGRYDKVHLVPFGEYVPFKKVFFFIESISKDVSDFYPGRDIEPVPVGEHPVGVVICYEAVFPHLARRVTHRGGQLLVNLTNDGWYGNSAAPYQHLAMSRWRAIENRRYLLRATNSGISAIIEPSGRIQAATGLLREEICTGRFAFLEARTVYSRTGDIFANLCVIIMTVFVLYGLVVAAVSNWTREKS